MQQRFSFEIHFGFTNNLRKKPSTISRLYSTLNLIELTRKWFNAPCGKSLGCSKSGHANRLWTWHQQAGTNPGTNPTWNFQAHVLYSAKLWAELMHYRDQSPSWRNGWRNQTQTQHYKSQECIVEYARGHRSILMKTFAQGIETQYQEMAKDQDSIGWRIM